MAKIKIYSAIIGILFSGLAQGMEVDRYIPIKAHLLGVLHAWNWGRQEKIIDLERALVDLQLGYLAHRCLSLKRLNADNNELLHISSDLMGQEDEAII